MSEPAQIQRFGDSPRWADVVTYRGTAWWVEVAEDAGADASGQITQVLAQIDATLAGLRSDRTQLLMVAIHLADLADAPVLNRHWDAWVAPGAPPVRVCVQSGLSGNLRVEMAITAAVPE